jgi:hypothetical protein
MAKGWIVEITYCEAGIEFEQRFDMAISDRDEALAAARRLVGPASRIQGIVAEELFDATFFGLGLAPGDVLPRLRNRR